MGAYHEIFVRPLVGDVNDAAVVANDLACMFGVQFEPVTTDHGVSYRVLVGETAIEVFASQDLLDDGDLPFESHPIEIDVRDLAKDEERERAVTQKAFQGLVRAAKYSLFATYNTQSLISSNIVDENIDGGQSG